MKITDIKQQLKDKARFSVFVDGKFSFSLGESALLKKALHLDQEISKDELDELQETSRVDKAYNRVLALLARRPRSEWEVQEYLKRKGYDRDFINDMTYRLYQINLLDDLAFARAWVENRRLLKATSQRRLSLELKQKHVKDEVIKEVLAEDETDEREVLHQLIARKRKQTRYQDDQKLMAYLMRQGFNYGDVKAAMSGADD
jgi:regulatory protein